MSILIVMRSSLILDQILQVLFQSIFRAVEIDCLQNTQADLSILVTKIIFLIFLKNETFSASLSCVFLQHPVVVRRVEKFKNWRRNIFRVGKYVYIFGGLKKVG